MKSTSLQSIKLPKTLLILGPPGVGKTSLALQTFKRVAIIDVDNNIGAAVPYIKRLGNGTLPDFEYFTVTQDDEGKPVERKLRYKRFAKIVNELMSRADIDTIVIDTLTTLVDVAIDEVRTQNGRKIADGIKIFQDDPLQIQDWGAFKFLMKHLVVTLKASGKTTVFNGHLNTDKDELTGVMQEFIACPGTLRTEIAALFSEVWLMSIEEKRTAAGVEYERFIRTAPKPSQQKIGLKSAIGVGNFDKLDLKTLKEKLEQ